MRGKYHVVKFLTRDDGEPVKRDKWHFVYDGGPGQATLCTCEFFGLGESGAETKNKFGYITCPDCIAKIKYFKSINP